MMHEAASLSPSDPTSLSEQPPAWLQRWITPLTH